MCLLRGTDWVFIMYYRLIFVFKSCVRAQAVSRQPLSTETRVRSHVSLCEIYGGRTGTRTGYSPSTWGFLLSISFHQCPLLIFIYKFLLPQGQTVEALGPSKKQ